MFQRSDCLSIQNWHETVKNGRRSSSPTLSTAFSAMRRTAMPYSRRVSAYFLSRAGGGRDIDALEDYILDASLATARWAKENEGAIDAMLRRGMSGLR
jgi:hypothetical protein